MPDGVSAASTSEHVPLLRFAVADVAVDKPDGRGRIVTYIFMRRPSYAIYEADHEVFVQWDDDGDKATAQIQTVLELLPLRRKLEYLADGLRCAKLYRQQIATALQTALEGKLDAAKNTLVGEIENATEERARIGRQSYLQAAGIVSLALAAVLMGVGGPLRGGASPTGQLMLSAAGGAIGALLSIAIAIRSRTVAPDHDRWTNLLDGLLRVVIGVIAGFALNLLLTTGVLPTLAAGAISIKSAVGWKGALLIGFAAGFLERMVPDLLEKQQIGTPAQKAKTTEPG